MIDMENTQIKAQGCTTVFVSTTTKDENLLVRVQAYAEYGDSSMTIRLNSGEAIALIAALNQAVSEITK